jgi:hypothetical protein
MALRGQALALGLVLWREAGIRKAMTFPLSQARLRDAAISRQAARRGLQALERAGLVIVKRLPGRCLELTILELAAPSNGRG